MYVFFYVSNHFKNNFHFHFVTSFGLHFIVFINIYKFVCLNFLNLAKFFVHFLSLVDDGY